MGKRLKIVGHDGVGEFDPAACYHDRIDIQKAKVDRLLDAGQIDDVKARKVFNHEKNVYEWNLKDMEMVEKLNKDLAIIIPYHLGQRPWLKACLDSCKETGYFILLVYDNPFWKTKDMDKAFMPEVMSLADEVVIKHRTYQRAVGVCHYWNMIYGLTLLDELGFSLAFNINGDCIMEKPEGFEELIGMLNSGDLFPNQYVEEQRYCGTMGWIGKVKMMLDFFHTYRKESFMYSRTTEGRLWYYAKEKGLKIIRPVNCEHNYKLPSPGTWYDLVGFRHLHAEHKVRPLHGLPPVEAKYVYG